MEPKVIFEDREILVLDKPAGLIVNRSDTSAGERTVQEWVENKFKVQSSKFKVDEESDFYKRNGIVHRLDKETSGILLTAKTKEAFENLQKQFKERKVKKTYIALVHGKLESKEGEINVPVGRLPWNRKKFGVLTGGREAVTKYKVLRFYEVRSGMLEAGPRSEKWDSSLHISHRFLASQFSHHTSYSLLELYPETGRTHQIRVHLKYFGHPIFSDPLYGGRKTARNDRRFLPRIFLHAARISFLHPKTKKLISFESQLPKQLSQFLATLNS